MTGVIDSPLAWALAWAARGVPVFPIGSKKAPACTHAFYGATTDPEAIRAWAASGACQFAAAAGHGVLFMDVDADDAKRAREGKTPHTWGEVARDDVAQGWPMGVDEDTGSGHFAFSAGPELGLEPPRTKPHPKDPEFLTYDLPDGTVTVGANLAGSNCVDWRHWGGYVRLKGPPPADGALPAIPRRLARQLMRAKGLAARVRKHERRAGKVRTVEDAVRHLEETARDGRHPALGRVVMPLVRFGVAGRELDPQHPTVVAVADAYTALVGTERNAVDEVHRDFASAFEEVGGEFVEPGKKRKRKAPKLDFEQAREALHSDRLDGRLAEQGWAIRYNLRALRAEVKEPGKPWVTLDKRRNAHLKVLLGALEWERDVWSALLDNTLYHSEVDPFLQWLEQLPAWDGVARVDDWCRKAFRVRNGHQHDEMAKWASIHVFLGSVKRTLEPGYKLDVSPVLEGPQGCGKSMHLASVFPHEMREFFGDTMDLGGRPKEMLEAIQGKVLVEIAEMNGLGSAKLDQLKAFLSRTHDNGIRMAYRPDPEEAARRCIFVPSVNNDGRGVLPNDASGNRRFAMVHLVGRGLHPSQLMHEREQYWAEALHRVKAGEDPAFPEALGDVQAELNEAMRQSDPLETLVDKAEEAVRREMLANSNYQGAPLLDLLDLTGMTGVRQKGKDGEDMGPKKAPGEVSKTEMMRLAQALKARGWVKRRARIYGRLSWLWRPPAVV